MTTTQQATKRYLTIDWSYPTSTNAKRFNAPNGCWTVNQCTINGDHATTKALEGGFASIDEASVYAAEVLKAKKADRLLQVMR